MPPFSCLVAYRVFPRLVNYGAVQELNSQLFWNNLYLLANSQQASRFLRHCAPHPVARILLVHLQRVSKRLFNLDSEKLGFNRLFLLEPVNSLLDRNFKIDPRLTSQNSRRSCARGSLCISITWLPGFSGKKSGPEFQHFYCDPAVPMLIERV